MTDPIALDHAQISAENSDARAAGTFDNPNPGQGDAPAIQDAPRDEPAAREPALSPQEQKRQAIFEAARQRRTEAQGEDGPVTEQAITDQGEHIPPFVKKMMDEQASADAEAARLRDEQGRFAKEGEGEARTYTLKVNGNNVPVANRDELVKLAEVEPDEGADLTDAQLIRLAQKQIAANQLLDEAKAARKTARVAAQADDTLSAENATNPDQPATETPPTPDQERAARRRELGEKIQYGDPEEAAAAIEELATLKAQEQHVEREFTTALDRVNNDIKAASAHFESQNSDLVSDPEIAGVLYNGATVRAIKVALVNAGYAQENVDRVVGDNIATAMDAYATVQASGKAKLPHPSAVLAAAAKHVRTKFNLPAPANTNTPAAPASRQTSVPTVPRNPGIDRTAAKRALAPQPNRASVPQSTAASQSGQGPERRSSVVAQMQAQRGRGPMKAA